jgi:uncharacterized protein YbjT (DUF2867 family)
MNILVLGATGNTGSAIVKQLKAKKADFGIMTSSKESAVALELREDQIRIGDFDDVASLTVAMEGISRIYLVMPMHPKTVDWVANVITAAKQAQVQHIVKQSGLNASITAKSQIIRDHAVTDELIRNSGLSFTLIQSNSFFQNLYGNLPTINSEGQFYAPLGNSSHSLVDMNDVASVAVAALTEEGHEGKTHRITGSESLTSAEQAKLLSEASGKEIIYVDIPKEALAEALKGFGMDSWTSEKIAEMMAWFAEEKGYSEVYNTIEDVLGRKPRPFSDFAQELSHSIKI